MARSVSDDVLDGAWNIIRNNCTRVTLCSAEPTSYTEGNATYALADVTVDSSDFTIANGDVSGRKITMSAQNGVLIDTTGTATHLACLDVTGTRLLYVTTTTSQGLTANGSNTVNIGSWKAEILDPSAP
jgi:hypothetical protein